MKAFLMAAVGALMFTALTGAELKIARYEVLPGNIFKAYGSSLDMDLVKGKDGKVSRKGYLTDGKLNYVPKTGVCYVFWRAKSGSSLVNFVVELEKSAPVKEVQIYGQNLSHMYQVKSAKMQFGDDEFSLQPGAEVQVPVKEQTKRDWKITIPCHKKAGMFKIAVWTGESKYLNVTEIKVIGEDQAK